MWADLGLWSIRFILVLINRMCTVVRHGVVVVSLLTSALSATSLCKSLMQCLCASNVPSMVGKTLRNGAVKTAAIKVLLRRVIVVSALPRLLNRLWCLRPSHQRVLIVLMILLMSTRTRNKRTLAVRVVYSWVVEFEAVRCALEQRGVRLVSLHTRAKAAKRSRIRLTQCLCAKKSLVAIITLFIGPVMFAEMVNCRRLLVWLAPASVQSLLMANAGVAK